MNNPREGQLWEAVGRFFYIVEVVRKNYLDPKFDMYRYIEFNGDMVSVSKGHLTIRRADSTWTSKPFNDFWTRLA